MQGKRVFVREGLSGLFWPNRGKGVSGSGCDILSEGDRDCEKGLLGAWVMR